mmetsp:Transcript_54251/g.126765  ORF Transcript_54251/g.126765 Transcript_54251/m.126765 type:complete len:378 (-) Transcript_54251:57-1190(-)
MGVRRVHHSQPGSERPPWNDVHLYSTLRFAYGGSSSHRSHRRVVLSSHHGAPQASPSLLLPTPCAASSRPRTASHIGGSQDVCRCNIGQPGWSRCHWHHYPANMGQSRGGSLPSPTSLLHCHDPLLRQHQTRWASPPPLSSNQADHDGLWGGGHVCNGGGGERESIDRRCAHHDPQRSGTASGRSVASTSEALLPLHHHDLRADLRWRGPPWTPPRRQRARRAPSLSHRLRWSVRRVWRRGLALCLGSCCGRGAGLPPLRAARPARQTPPSHRRRQCSQLPPLAQLHSGRLPPPSSPSTRQPQPGPSLHLPAFRSPSRRSSPRPGPAGRPRDLHPGPPRLSLWLPHPRRLRGAGHPGAGRGRRRDCARAGHSHGRRR